jgi:hypothetical protein
MGRPFLA